MGADITWTFGDDGEWYFRDAYNSSNLAWVIGLSYWQGGKTLAKRKDFFEKLAAITDKQISAWAEEKEDEFEGGADTAIKMLTKKRDDVKKHIKKIKNATHVSWSV